MCHGFCKPTPPSLNGTNPESAIDKEKGLTCGPISMGIKSPFGKSGVPAAGGCPTLGSMVEIELKAKPKSQT